MVCYFKPEDIEKLHAGREDMHRQFAELRDRFLGRKYQTEHGHEFAYHGSRGALVGLIGPKLRNRPSRRTDGEVGADTRGRNLKNQAYGNTSDWVMLFTAHVDAGGKTEIDVLARLAKYKVVRMYYKDGKQQEAAEMLKISFSVALAAMQESLKGVNASEIRKASKTSDYEFSAGSK